MKRYLALASFAIVLPLLAQEKKPAPAKPAKPDRAAQARAAVNEAKQDERNKERVKEFESALKKALKNNEAAEAEINRLKKTEEAPDGKDAKATLEKLKNSVDKNDMKEFEALLKESTQAMKEEIKAYQDKRRAEGKSTLTPGAPASAVDPPPVSFDNVPAPAPMPLTKAPEFPVTPTVEADDGVICGERDPRNPDVLLPVNDPRRRMWVLSGKVRVRRPFMALDANEVDLFWAEGQAQALSGSNKGKVSATAVKPAAPAVDPGGRTKHDDEPFERIIARGNVRLMFVDRIGIVKVARGGSMIYDAKTGIFLIKEWPEAEVGDKLLVGPDKTSVIKLNNIKSDDPDWQLQGLKITTLERRLTAEDMPRTTGQQVPGAGAVKPKSPATPAPAPSPAPR